MSNESLDRVAHLLHAVVEGFFVAGEISGESAYACAALASVYVDRLRGEDKNCGLIKLYESSPRRVPIMYSSDMAVEKQISQLEAQLDMLRNASPPRHQLNMALLGPNVQPVSPAAKKRAK